jgi:trans-aconitate 2-methyltransferase
MSWNPEQYLKFAQARLRPALELLARVDLVAPTTVYDLGCGTGTATRIMAERWPSAAVIGVDGSADMLERTSGGLRNLRWLQQDLVAWAPASAADLIYSNAALHWLPGHDRLFPALVSHLAPGGVLAVQMPRNFCEPSHLAIGETVLDGPWRSRLEPLLRPPPVADPRWYLDLLAPVAGDVDVWETQYFQVLRGADPVMEWTKGTWLKPFLDALEAGERDAFERAYARRVGDAYPRRSDGTTVFPFRRLFIIARRSP